MRHVLSVFLLTTVASACAQTVNEPVTANTFGIVVSGETFEFHRDTDSGLELLGAERYFPDQTVVWMLTDGTCFEGVWFQQNEQICFNYGDQDHCWVLDEETPEPEAVFSYTTGLERQVAFPTEISVPRSCSALIS